MQICKKMCIITFSYLITWSSHFYGKLSLFFIYFQILICNNIKHYNKKIFLATKYEYQFSSNIYYFKHGLFLLFLFFFFNNRTANRSRCFRCKETPFRYFSSLYRASSFLLNPRLLVCRVTFLGQPSVILAKLIYRFQRVSLLDRWIVQCRYESLDKTQIKLREILRNV